jgi:hypothetical protein
MPEASRSTATLRVRLKAIYQYLLSSVVHARAFSYLERVVPEVYFNAEVAAVLEAF